MNSSSTHILCSTICTPTIEVNENIFINRTMFFFKSAHVLSYQHAENHGIVYQQHFLPHTSLLTY